MYKWVKGNSFNKVATVYAGNITLNVPCISLFENAKWCVVGIDYDSKKVGIKIVGKDELDKKTFSEDTMNKVSIGKSFIRICNKSIIKEISKATKKRAEGEKFSVNYNAKDKLLEIDLNSPL
ncbi:MAG: hypothetical protein IJP71_03370 [Lachnospiraceae bacterium]|nr:hypothetical protein [Lachnospiraceae bacterium]